MLGSVTRSVCRTMYRTKWAHLTRFQSRLLVYTISSKTQPPRLRQRVMCKWSTTNYDSGGDDSQYSIALTILAQRPHTRFCCHLCFQTVKSKHISYQTLLAPNVLSGWIRLTDIFNRYLQAVQEESSCQQ